MTTPISRRSLLAGAAAAGLLAPFMRRTRRAHADAITDKTKALFVYVPDGCIPDRWHPTGSETSFTLRPMTEPLAAVRQHLVFLKGLDMYEGGATHEGGIRKVLTGNNAQSLDVFLGQRLNAVTPLPHASIQLGIGANFQNGSGGFSFIGAGQEVKPDDNPIAAFTRIFGAAPGGVGGGGSEPSPALLRRRSIVDLASSDLQRTRSRLGATEREKLDVHVESFLEVERRVNGGGGGGAGCTASSFDTRGFAVIPTDYYPKTYEKEEEFQRVGELQMDIAALSLSCGMTRVASLMWSHPVSPTRILASGATLGNHDASHYGNADSATAAAFIQIKRWFMERFVYLIRKLETTPDPAGGNLIDNTIVFLCSELGDSNNHDHRNMPFLLAGHAAGQLTTNRLVDYTGSATGGANQPHSKLLVSIAKLMGVQIDSFGYTGLGTGGLPDLNA
jgi:hypothetical protein